MAGIRVEHHTKAPDTDPPNCIACDDPVDQGYTILHLGDTEFTFDDNCWKQIDAYVRQGMDAHKAVEKVKDDGRMH